MVINALLWYYNVLISLAVLLLYRLLYFFEDKGHIKKEVSRSIFKWVYCKKPLVQRMVH